MFKDGGEGVRRRRPMWEGDNVEVDGRMSELVGKIYDFQDEDLHVSINTIRIQFGDGMTTLHRIYQ